MTPYQHSQSFLFLKLLLVGIVLGCFLIPTGDCSQKRPRKQQQQATTNKNQANVTEAPTNPILIVPGVGGSILNYYDKKTNQYLGRCWVVLLWADETTKRYALSRYNDATNHVDSLNPNVTIGVDDSACGLFGISILDPEDWSGGTKYFQAMISTLQSAPWNYVPCKTLFGFPYDWRQSNYQQLPRIMAAIENAYRASGNAKVHIVAHSMGNVITKLYLAMFPTHARTFVASWNAIAAPFLGAAGFGFQTLLRGKAELPTFLLSRDLAHAVQVSISSTYEILPAENSRWQASAPQLQFFFNTSEGIIPANVTIDRYPDVARGALSNYSLDYYGTQVPFRFGDVQWSNAQKARQLYQHPLKESFPFQFNSIVGVGYPTPYDMVYQAPINTLSDLISDTVQNTFSYVDGDGTVPMESALADGMPNRYLVYSVQGKHAEMIRQTEVIDLVLCFVGRTACPIQTGSARLIYKGNQQRRDAR